MQGWISLHRKIVENELWHDKPFSRGQAWIDILLMVNHKDEQTLFDGNIVTVKRGSRITSIRKLCDRWGWSNKKVTKFLEVLEREGMVVKKSDTKKTVLTVANYGMYQNEDLEKRHRSDTEATQKHTNNNDNKLNNIYIFWNEQSGLIKHKELTPKFKKAIEKALKQNTEEEIIQSISRCNQAVIDTDYYYSYRWNLEKFMTQKNGYTNWLDDGQLWNNYKGQAQMEEPKKPDRPLTKEEQDFINRIRGD